jgi:hypothetical protein
MEGILWTARLLISVVDLTTLGLGSCSIGKASTSNGLACEATPTLVGHPLQPCLFGRAGIRCIVDDLPVAVDDDIEPIAAIRGEITEFKWASDERHTEPRCVA